MRTMTKWMATGAFVLAAGITAQAAWIMVADFDDYDLGQLVGQDGWVGTTGDNSHAVITDPTDSGNQVMRMVGGGGLHYSYRSLGTEIDNNTVSTLFFRSYVTTGDPNSTVNTTSTTTSDSSNDFASQFQARDGDFTAREGGSHIKIDDYDYGTWYNVWTVIDNGQNEHTYYMSTGTNEAVLVGRTYGFRNNITDSIKTIQMNSWASGSGQWLIDDIYISSGVNTTMIPEPATGGLLLLGAAAGLGLLRRKLHG